MGKLFIEVGNIVDNKFLNKADAIINATNPMMRYGSGVCGAIFEKAGILELENYIEQTFGISYDDSTRKNEMKVTEVRVTPGFNIPCDIIFAQGPKVWEYESYVTAENLLLKTYENVISFAIKKGYKSILLPCLGTGIYGFSHKLVAKKVVSLIKGLIKDFPLDVFLVIYDEDVKDLYLNFAMQ